MVEKWRKWRVSYNIYSRFVVCFSLSITVFLARVSLWDSPQPLRGKLNVAAKKAISIEILSGECWYRLG